MQPLATYHERFPLVMDRKFELYEDRIVVTKTRLLSRQEVPLELAKLDPNAGKHWRVKPYFPLVACLSIVLLILSPLTINTFPRPVAWLHWMLSLSSLLSLVWTLRKVEWAEFRNLANIVALDVAQFGPDKEKHEAFVDRILMQIELARQMMMQSAVIRLQNPPEDDADFDHG